MVATPATLDEFNKCSATGFDKVCAASVGASSGANYTDCLAYLSGGNDANGAFVHTNSCDRTVSYDASSDFRSFPLQAKDADVESMLSNDLNHDRSFSCQYSVNADATKINARIPTSGCCGVINGNAVLKSLINGGPGSAGHLEPLLNSTSPTVRLLREPRRVMMKPLLAIIVFTLSACNALTAKPLLIKRVT